MWLFGQFAATGCSAASYQQAEEPVSQLINYFGPSVAVRLRSAMPFVHLERELWDLRDAGGRELAPDDAPSRWSGERTIAPLSVTNTQTDSANSAVS